MKRRNDDIEKLIEGKEPIAEALPPIKDARGYAKHKYGLSHWGTPEHKAPAPPLSGEQDVKHRSKGKGNLGLDADDKSEATRSADLIKLAIGHERALQLAFELDEWAAAEAKRIEELRRRLGNRKLSLWGTSQPKKARYLAKELR